MIMEFLTVPCAPKEKSTEKHGKEGVKECTHVMMDCVCGVSKMEVDVEGHERPATFDDAGGCPLASMLAGPPLTVALGVNADDPTKGVVDVCVDHLDVDSEKNEVH